MKTGNGIILLDLITFQKLLGIFKSVILISRDLKYITRQNKTTKTRK